MTLLESSETPRVRQWLESLGPPTTGLLGHQSVRFYQFRGEALEAGLVAVRDSSVLYPVFPQRLTEELQRQLDPVHFKLRDSICLMGPTAWMQPLEAVMDRWAMMRQIDYDFLVRPASSPDTTSSLRITRARPRDAVRLFSLQEGYEKEEVLFSPEEFEPLASWLAFQKVLKEQLVYVVWEDGQPVAMARTNARSEHWSQVGGVYTRPAFRRRGLQKQLMATLVGVLAEAGQGACLFVKKANLAAFNLYWELGFGSPEDFRISYWVRRSV